MASEYLLKKYKDVKPDVIPEMTPEEKRKNWWHYHRYHVLIGVILALCLADILGHALGIGKVQPDITIAYYGSAPLSAENAQRFIRRIEEFCPDMNGDGKIRVVLEQYNAIRTDDSDSLYYAQAAQIKLVTDALNCVSFLFLMEEPGKVQEATSVLIYPDGTYPAEGDLNPEGKYILLRDIPAFADLAEDPAFAELSIARRGFWTEKTVPNLPQCEQLWENLLAANG